MSTWAQLNLHFKTAGDYVSKFRAQIFNLFIFNGIILAAILLKLGRISFKYQNWKGALPSTAKSSRRVCVHLWLPKAHVEAPVFGWYFLFAYAILRPDP